jgi:hypothetical protein
VFSGVTVSVMNGHSTRRVRLPGGIQVTTG